ncbi:hypothetical protein AB0C96_25180 [Streptomyces sp. NPDC048506]|uniref:hypothetical protein n=1 Tax=Streptomyces sp. NPDC048506 TaxID=3155028 RepID=UPI003429D6C1
MTARARAARAPGPEDGVDDVAALVVNADAKGRRLTDVVGGQAIAFHRRVGGKTLAFGSHGDGLESSTHMYGPALGDVAEQASAQAQRR